MGRKFTYHDQIELAGKRAFIINLYINKEQTDRFIDKFEIANQKIELIRLCKAGRPSVAKTISEDAQTELRKQNIRKRNWGVVRTDVRKKMPPCMF